MTIICGTDFSEPASHAVNVAAAIATRLGEELRIVYAFDKKSSEQILASAEEVVLATIRQRLRNEVERVRKGGAAAETEILTGAPDEALVELARSRRASLVVVSAIGSRSASFWTLGSVAERTARTSPSPVLVVRDPQPFLQWTRGNRALRVIVGIDPTGASDAAVRWLRDLRRVGPCDVSFAHVYSPIEESRRLGLPLVPIPGPPSEVEPVLERDLRERLARCGEEDPRLLLQSNLGRSADALVHIASDEDADLLVVGSNRRGTLDRAKHGSVSYTALHLARMSVASVPVGAISDLQVQPKAAFRHIIAALRSIDGDTRVTDYAVALVPSGGTLHVVCPGDAGSEPQIGGRISEALGDALASRTLHIELFRSEGFADAIHHAAERSDADVICVATEEGEALLRLSKRPVLVVRAS
jgi:nucleotide-binding universal stress UspA family protein